jgi:flagellar hook-associated protein 3 FlgL
MRVSTSMVFDAGVRKVNEQTGSLLKLQQQISTGRRIVNPSDDPVAAARVLELTQSSDVVAQFSRNRDGAESALSLQETQLEGVGSLITRVRELAIQVGNGTLTRENRSAVTAELRARFEEMLGYANARDGNGKYIFSGYMGDTRPYAGSVETGVTYFGDDGQRQLQVSPSRILAVSDSGRSIFERISNGNGTFVTGVNDANKGSAIIDSGAIVDLDKWNTLSSKNHEIRFQVDSNSVPPKTYYDIVDTQEFLADGVTANPMFGNSLLTGAALPTPLPGEAGAPPAQRVYKSGQPIVLAADPDPAKAESSFDFGANVVINGDPKDGDSFSIEPSSTQNIFDTLRTLIADAERPTGTEYDQALLANRLGFALTNLDQAEVNVLRVRSLIGSRLNEIQSLQSINEDTQIQYQAAISNLQDLDYAKTLSDFARRQTDLEAAQKSFMQITSMSLFDYVR